MLRESLGPRPRGCVEIAGPELQRATRCRGPVRPRRRAVQFGRGEVLCHLAVQRGRLDRKRRRRLSRLRAGRGAGVFGGFDRFVVPRRQGLGDY